MPPQRFPGRRWLPVAIVVLATYLTLSITWWLTAQAQTDGAGASAVTVDAFEVTVIHDSPPHNPKKVGETVTFTAVVPIDSARSFSYTWSFGDGGTDTGFTVPHIYTRTGTFQAQVIVSNGSESVRKTTEVRIIPIPPPPPTPPPPPPSGLSADCDDPIDANNPVTCVASVAVGDNVLYEWNWGDGSPPEEGATITHIYKFPGVYRVFVIGRKGVTYRERFDLNVVINEEPIVGLDFIVEEPIRSRLPIKFTAVIQRGSNVSYDWTFGDGSVQPAGLLTETVHTYLQKGSYDVIVHARNGTYEQTFSRRLTVLPQRPTVTQAFNDSPKPRNERIQFFIASISEEQPTYFWEFGDGTTFQTMATMVSHVYPVTRTYAVRVAVANSGGSMDHLQIAYVGVDRPLQTTTIFPNREIVIPRQWVTFTTPLEGDQYTFLWDFGDGTPPQPTDESEIAHAYTTSGLYVVSVTATPRSGNPDPDVKQGDLALVVGYGLSFPIIARMGGFESSLQSISTPAIEATTTETPTVAATATPMATATPTATPTPTTADTPTPIPTPTVNIIEPSVTPTPTPSHTITSTPTLPPTPTATLTTIPTATATPTATFTETPTPIDTPSGNGTIPPLP